MSTFKRPRIRNQPRQSGHNKEIDVLYRGITFQDLMCIYHQLGRDLTFEEEADLIMDVAKIENGQTKLNVEMLSAIVEALGGTV